MFSPLLTCLNSIGFVRCSSRNLVLVTVTFAMVRLDDVVLFFIADFLPALQRQIFGMMSRCFYRGRLFAGQFVLQLCWEITELPQWNSGRQTGSLFYWMANATREMLAIRTSCVRLRSWAHWAFNHELFEDFLFGRLFGRGERSGLSSMERIPGVRYIKGKGKSKNLDEIVEYQRYMRQRFAFLLELPRSRIYYR